MCIRDRSEPGSGGERRKLCIHLPDALSGLYFPGGFRQCGGGRRLAGKPVPHLIGAGPCGLREMCIRDRCSVLPAFSLDLTSVLFASAAPAASEGEFALKDAFTFRYKDTSLGSAVINSAQSNVKVNNAPNGTCLLYTSKGSRDQR